jgi:hypothetical protein
MLNPDLSARADALAAQFQRREPFRHVVIENFFDEATAAAFLRDFPPFERGNARNEDGELAGKSTVEKIRELGPDYAALDDTIQSREFLDLIGRITDIPDLRYDPWYFGGGTHENRAGQDLDPHIDFNKHPVEPWHRRLNLIVYLNREWHDNWGGSLELHSDPRTADDKVTLLTPLFNRAVIFETTEWSWHGFSRIELPQDKQQLTRKSIALYFYTSERPAEEMADTHSTVYVDRPLPERFHAGMTLEDSDVQELQILLARRDQHNQRLYRDVTSLTKQLEQANSALQSGRLGRLRYFARRLLAALRRD